MKVKVAKGRFSDLEASCAYNTDAFIDVKD